MSSTRRFRFSMVALAVAMMLSATVAQSDAAAPIGVECGSVITADTTLRADVGPCPDNGLIVGADDITIDLAGHTVFGTPEVGDGAGMLVLDSTGVKVMNGTVRDFDAGVVIQGGGSNHITGIVARDNIGQSEGHPPAPAPSTVTASRCWGQATT